MQHSPLLMDLPIELHEAVLMQVQPTQVSQMALVCRGWWQLLASDSFWKHYCELHFGVPSRVTLAHSGSWMAECREVITYLRSSEAKQKDIDKQVDSLADSFLSTGWCFLPWAFLGGSTRKRRRMALESERLAGTEALLSWAATRGSWRVALQALSRHSTNTGHQRCCISASAMENALFYAACHGQHELAQVLLAQPAVDFNRSHPLFIASYHGQTQVVKLLLAKGAQVDKTNDNGASPLYVACQNGHLGVVRLLLDHHASPFLPKSNGATPLLIAASNNHTDVVRLLLSHCGTSHVNMTKKNGISPLFVACYNGNVDIVEMLLSHGADVHLAIGGGSGPTPLYIGCQQGHLEVASMLLSHGADINTTIPDGTTPLFICCQEGHTHIAKLLIARGAQARKARRNGTTPLDIASLQNHSAIVRLLAPLYPQDHPRRLEMQTEKKEDDQSEEAELSRKCNGHGHGDDDDDGAHEDDDKLERPVCKPTTKTVATATTEAGCECATTKSEIRLKLGVDIGEEEQHNNNKEEMTQMTMMMMMMTETHNNNNKTTTTTIATSSFHKGKQMT